MGYYCAWGDAKIMSSSEEEEGYENLVSDIGEKRKGRALDIHGEAPSAPALPISDDTDRQFWAEDELSNSESRQRLITKRKRRHSVSYRNRAANKSQSRVPRPSNSSSDSTRAEISPKIRRIRRCWLKSKTEKLQSGIASCTSNEEIYTVNKAVSSEHQTVSTSGSRLEGHKIVLSHINCYEQPNNMLRDVKKVRLKRACGLSKSKQKIK